MMLQRTAKLIFFLLLVVALAGAFFLFVQWHHFYTKPLPDTLAIIHVKPQSTARQVIQTLENEGFVDSPKLVLFFVKATKSSALFKAGYYQVQPNETLPHLLHRIMKGDVIHDNFLIVEGSNMHQIGEKLTQASYLTYQDTDWQSIQNGYLSSEGLVLADTYRYAAGSDAKELLSKANKSLFDYLQESWTNRDPSLPYKSAYELLIAASILQKESALISEQKIISGVIVNRLQKRMPLQMDPTVIYAMGRAYQGKLSHEDMKINSPYNTYTNVGLPPTPIAMVGKLAIDAAAHPMKSNYLYFVAKGDGSHVFSETYEQQLQAIKQYLHGGN